jgi:hypothetical protein
MVKRMGTGSIPVFAVFAEVVGVVAVISCIVGLAMRWKYQVCGRTLSYEYGTDKIASLVQDRDQLRYIRKERPTMTFDFKSSISFLVCAAAIGLSALLLSAPVEKPQENLVLTVRT